MSCQLVPKQTIHNCVSLFLIARGYNPGCLTKGQRIEADNIGFELSAINYHNVKRRSTDKGYSYKYTACTINECIGSFNQWNHNSCDAGNDAYCKYAAEFNRFMIHCFPKQYQEDLKE